uniref:Bardet-Biedl syndrome 7 n=1 Tax=Oncorhynchus mykiss TaxID=8022 RepID=A0A8C7USD7_ONCMY
GMKKGEAVVWGASYETPQKIFVCAGSEVKGYTNKGKQFLSFEANLTESINAMHVSDTDLFVCASYIYNHYCECKDQDYYLSGDKINDIVCLSAENLGHCPCVEFVFSCPFGSALLYDIEVPGPPSVLELYNRDGGTNGEDILYGTVDSKLGLIRIADSYSSSKWEIDNDKMKGGTRLLKKDDGTVEVYAIDSSDNIIHVFVLSERVTSIHGGCVGKESYDEVLTATYTGWVTGLTTEPQQAEVGPGEEVKMRSGDPEQTHVTLRAELDQLQMKVLQGSVKYQQTSQSSTAISAMHMFSVNDKFTLCQDDASYSLTLEVQTAIGNLLLQLKEIASTLYFLCCVLNPKGRFERFFCSGPQTWVKVYISDDSVSHTLKMIRLMLEYQLHLAKKFQLIDSLKGNADFLTPEYCNILDESAYLTECQDQRCHCCWKCLDNYDLDSLMNFFNEDTNFDTSFVMACCFV